MPILITMSPNKQFAATETVTIAKLNQLGQGTAQVTGTVGTTDLAAGAVTSPKTTAGPFEWATSTFAANTYTLTFTSSTAPTAKTDGTEVTFKALTDNAGAAFVTIGSVFVGVEILKNGSESLEIGDIICGSSRGMVVHCRYMSAIDKFQMLNVTALPALFRGTTTGSSGTYEVTLNASTGISNAVTLASIAGRPICLKLHQSAAGADTLAVRFGTATALAAKKIKRNGNVELSPGDIILNQEITVIYETTSDCYHLQTPTANPTNLGIVASVRGLIVKNNGSNPTRDVDVTADAITLQASTTSFVIGQAISLTISLSVTGVNGLDTGTGPGSLQAAWYYIYVISDGSVFKGLMSLSATAPTMPTGYTYKALVGTVYNATAATYALGTFYQQDRSTWLNPSTIFTALTGQTSYFALSTQATEWALFKTFVPPIGKTISGIMGNTNAAGRCIVVAANSSGLGASYWVGANTGGVAIDSYLTAGSFTIPLQTAQDFNMKMNTTDATYKLQVTGYTI